MTAAPNTLLEALKKPWLLSDADKCRLGSLLVLLQLGPFLGFALLFKLRPQVAPYIDQAALQQTLLLLGLIGCAFAATLTLSVFCRKRPRAAKILSYVFCQCFAVGFAAVACEVGQYTSDTLGGVLLTGGIVGLLLFDRRAVLLGAASALLIIGGASAAQVAGWLPYAPLLAASPVGAHRLAGAWMASLGVLMFAIEIIACSILCYFLYRLRDREAALARARQLVSRYVPAQVVAMLAEGDNPAVTQHQRRKLTLFFSDLVGFTEIAERTEPEDLSLILNEYFTAMTDIAQRYNGTVDELSGDAILIFFGAPEFSSDADHALRAVRMAREMQQAVQALNARWLGRGIEESFSVRMGINTGVVTVGNFGSAGRMKYAVIGKHINLAARLEAICTPGGILISHSTWLLVREHIPCRVKGEVELKGVQRPVRAYEVIDGDAALWHPNVAQLPLPAGAAARGEQRAGMLDPER